MTSLQYINEKLSDAIYILATHEGDACTRLAKILPKVNHLSISSFPKELQPDIKWVEMTINKGIGETNSRGFPPPNKLNGISNSTASEVIKKILYIQNLIQTYIDSGLDC